MNVYRYIGTVPGRPLEPTIKDQVQRLTRLYAECRNMLDPEPLIAELADGVRYYTQHSFDDCEGKEAVADHLRVFFARVTAIVGQVDTGVCHLGEVDLAEGAGWPCAIYEAFGERRSLTYVHANQTKKISQIIVCTVAPAPSEARLIKRLLAGTLVPRMKS